MRKESINTRGSKCVISIRSIPNKRPTSRARRQSKIYEGSGHEQEELSKRA